MKTILFLFLMTSAVYCNLWGQHNITDSIVHQSYQRKFMVHFPPHFNANTQKALVVNLHGGSGTMVNAQGFSQLNPVADQNNFILAWPQGYGIAPPGFSWADGRNTSADQAGIDDIGFIDKLLDTLISRYNVDSKRIYICGFSNGGFMVQRLACQKPNRFAAMASLGSSMDTLLYKNCNPSKPIPMAFFNGTSDPAMPYEGGPMQNPQVTPVVPVDSTVQFWVKRNDCQTSRPVYNFPDRFPSDNSTAELYAYSNCTCDANVSFFKLINGGHTWPGVYIASQAAVLGNTNRDLNAGIELWEFFNAHTLCQPTVGTEEYAFESTIEFFPNPATTTLHLRPKKNELFQISIQNHAGQILLTQDNPFQIDLSDFKNGLYFLTFQQGQHLETKKFIKLE